ncbi:MAG: aminopeptidase P family protein [Ruminococcaceae bacterium]|nr:aminopeptidase P family protein [Oscillospiraceae bacterium]
MRIGRNPDRRRSCHEKLLAAACLRRHETMSIYKQRVEALVKQLPEDVDAALVSSQVNLFYFTGFDCDNAWLIADRKGCVYVTDFRYTEAAQSIIDFCDVIELGPQFSDTMAAITNQRGITSLLVERSRVTIEELDKFDNAFVPAKIKTDARLDDIIRTLRDIKAPFELELIKASQAVTEMSYRKLLTYVKEGVTEKELAIELEYIMRKNGAQRKAFDFIVAAGPNGSMPHAVPTDYRIKKGDLITFDIGAVVGGYHSDMTRTVALGDPGEEQKKIYNTVLEAQKAACEYLVSGGRGRRECDGVARDIINKEFEGRFGHSLGHGVGLEIHETPNLAPRSEGELAAGNVVTVEPGIYIPGKCGVRIEDMVYITEDSAINLTSIEKELVIL